MRSCCSVPVSHSPEDSLLLEARCDTDRVVPGEPFHVLLTLSLCPTRPSTTYSATVGGVHNEKTQGALVLPMEPQGQQIVVTSDAISPYSSQDVLAALASGNSNNQQQQQITSATSKDNNDEQQQQQTPKQKVYKKNLGFFCLFCLSLRLNYACSNNTSSTR